MEPLDPTHLFGINPESRCWVTSYSCNTHITGLPVVFVLWLLVGSDVVHSLSGDHTYIDVVAWAEVTHDACMDCNTHQLLRLLQLREFETDTYRTRRRRQRPVLKSVCSNFQILWGFFGLQCNYSIKRYKKCHKFMSMHKWSTNNHCHSIQQQLYM